MTWHLVRVTGVAIALILVVAALSSCGPDPCGRLWPCDDRAR